MKYQTCNVSALKYHQVRPTRTSGNVVQFIRIKQQTDNWLGQWVGAVEQVGIQEKAK